MTDKRFFLMYRVIFGCVASIMVILMILLFFEYRFFCHQTYELMQLKKQYNSYIQVLQKKSDERYDEECDEVDSLPSAMTELSVAEESDDPDDDDEYSDESFVVINRHPDYLKQSTLDYMQSQDLSPLMTAIDMNRWSDYTDQVITGAEQKQNPCTKPVVKEKIKNKRISLQKPTKDFGFMWPIDEHKFWLSSLFGPRKRIDGTWGFHHGIDMAAVKGTTVKSVRAGTVIEAGFHTGYGNTVVIKHNETIKTRYAHLHTVRAHVGQTVKQGAVVGTVGETGLIRKKGKDGSHLHFEVYERGKRINPLQCLPRMA